VQVGPLLQYSPTARSASCVIECLVTYFRNSFNWDKSKVSIGHTSRINCMRAWGWVIFEWVVVTWKGFWALSYLEANTAHTARGSL